MTDPPRILLVTGARFLERVDGARAWVIEAVVDVVRMMHPTVLVMGDAPGPDTWVRGIAHALPTPLPAFVYVAQTGEIVRWWEGQPETVGSWIREDELRKIPRVQRPLSRNAQMVRHVATKDPDAMCAGFVITHPDRTTHGTEHTLGWAEVKGLTTRTWTWGFSSARGDGVMPVELEQRREAV